MTIQKAVFLALSLVLSGNVLALDCYLVNGERVCVKRIGMPPVKTLGDIQRERAQSDQQQQLIDNQLLLQQLEIESRIKQKQEPETARIFGIFKNSANKLSAPERTSLKTTITSLPEDKAFGLLRTLAALSEDERVSVLKVLANMPEQDKSRFYAELFK